MQRGRADWMPINQQPYSFILGNVCVCGGERYLFLAFSQFWGFTFIRRVIFISKCALGMFCFEKPALVTGGGWAGWDGDIQTFRDIGQHSCCKLRLLVPAFSWYIVLDWLVWHSAEAPLPRGTVHTYFPFMLHLAPRRGELTIPSWTMKGLEIKIVVYTDSEHSYFSPNEGISPCSLSHPLEMGGLSTWLLKLSSLDTAPYMSYSFPFLRESNRAIRDILCCHAFIINVLSCKKSCTV